MHTLPVLVVALLALAACGPPNQDQPPGDSADTAIVAADEPGTLSAGDAYDRACARCHDTGLDGAPKTGDPDAWAGRSSLWEAVLFEHAKKGFLAMPAQTGENFPDATVAAAAEYMMQLTHPETPPD